MKCLHCNRDFDISKTKRYLNYHIWRKHTKEGSDFWERNKQNLSTYIWKKVVVSKKCISCGKSFEVVRIEGRRGRLRERKCCSFLCSHRRTWSVETNNKRREKQLGRVSPKRVERFDRSCEYCGAIFKDRIKSKVKCCSVVCSNLKMRSDNTARVNYRLDCSFKFNIYKYPKEFDLGLIERFGWYKAKNRGDNCNGISRDHIVSVNYGYTHNIDPKIIRHPANCRLLRHRDNMIKGRQSSISFPSLLNRIRIWDAKYNNDGMAEY